MAEVTVEDGNDSITRVLFCGYNFPGSHNYTREYLQSYPFIQVDTVALDEVPDVIHKYHICVAKNRRLDSKLIAKAAQMKLIMQFGVGLEGVNVDAATKHKIKVARIPGSATGNSTSCAEMAIYLILGLLRKFFWIWELEIWLFDEGCCKSFQGTAVGPPNDQTNIDEIWVLRTIFMNLLIRLLLLFILLFF